MKAVLSPLYQCFVACRPTLKLKSICGPKLLFNGYRLRHRWSRDGNANSNGDGDVGSGRGWAFSEAGCIASGGDLDAGFANNPDLACRCVVWQGATRFRLMFQVTLLRRRLLVPLGMFCPDRQMGWRLYQRLNEAENEWWQWMKWWRPMACTSASAALVAGASNASTDNADSVKTLVN